MKVLIFLLLVSCQSSNPHVDVLYGFRDFQDQSEWEQTNQQDDIVGVSLEFCGARDGFGAEVGYTFSDDTSRDPLYVNRSVDDTTTTVEELYFGVRQNKMFNDWLQFSIGGGISIFRLDTDVDLSYADAATDRDTGYAPYVQIGTRVFATENLTVGALYRYHFWDAEEEIFVTNPDIDGDAMFLTIGWSF